VSSGLIHCCILSPVSCLRCQMCCDLRLRQPARDAIKAFNPRCSLVTCILHDSHICGGSCRSVSFGNGPFIPLFIPHTSTSSSRYNTRQSLQRTQLLQAMSDHPGFYQQMYPHLHTADMPPAPPPSPAPQKATTGYLQF
jgi:hypothetical protein